MGNSIGHIHTYVPNKKRRANLFRKIAEKQRIKKYTRTRYQCTRPFEEEGEPTDIQWDRAEREDNSQKQEHKLVRGRGSIPEEDKKSKLEEKGPFEEESQSRGHTAAVKLKIRETSSRS